nr:50S ribosomal protein L9 [Anaerolineae bacterium]
MKVILLEDVYKQGVAGDVVDVAPGYARNFLIPQRKAVKVTPGALRALESLRKSTDMRREEQEKENSIIAEKVRDLTLYFPVKASPTGKLYGSITSTDIAERLVEEIGLEIDRRRIGDHPLRELGTFPVVVRLDTGQTPELMVVIHREGEDPTAVAEDEGTVESVEQVEIVEEEVLEADLEDEESGFAAEIDEAETDEAISEVDGE